MCASVFECLAWEGRGGGWATSGISKLDIYALSTEAGRSCANREANPLVCASFHDPRRFSLLERSHFTRGPLTEEWPDYRWRTGAEVKRCVSPQRRDPTSEVLICRLLEGRRFSLRDLFEHFKCARFKLTQCNYELLVLLRPALLCLRSLIQLPMEFCNLGLKVCNF
jgi:hypothetical protein